MGWPSKMMGEEGDGGCPLSFKDKKIKSERFENATQLAWKMEEESRNTDNL